MNGSRSPADTTIAAVLASGTIGRLREVICWSRSTACVTAATSDADSFRTRGGQILSGPFSALHLRSPATVFGAGSTSIADAIPESMAIRYEFAADHQRPGLVLTWYDGEWAPPYESVDGIPLSSSGALYLGQSGQILDDGVSGRRTLMCDQVPPRELPQASVISRRVDRVAALVDASIVAGIVSYRVQQSLEWDGAALTVRNCPPAETLFQQLFRGAVRA